MGDLGTAHAEEINKIEDEFDATVRILSKLKGEARKGAETALRDLYKQLNFWGDEIDED